ncbi:MAG: acyl carrier protein [Proteobacteria bacterium]|uniref:acyl carrier protein n=1 Tax=Aquabacterium sp. TaxID=1872578 RepID=UPI0035C68B5C|nr:acyl carrier protein [Pseudomonadota bacterium]
MSQTAITLTEALEMMADAFNEPLENVRPDTPRDSIPGWDSMGALMLIAELDERFGIELTAEVSREMRQVQHVLDFLAQHGALSA